MAFVYFIATIGQPFVKIGVASDIRRRIDQLQVSSPFELQLLGVIRTPDASALEGHLHIQFHTLRVRGEWFHLEAELAAYVEANAEPLDAKRKRRRTNFVTDEARHTAAQRAYDASCGPEAYEAWKREDALKHEQRQA